MTVLLLLRLSSFSPSSISTSLVSSVGSSWLEEGPDSKMHHIIQNMSRNYLSILNNVVNSLFDWIELGMTKYVFVCFHLLHKPTINSSYYSKGRLLVILADLKPKSQLKCKYP